MPKLNRSTLEMALIGYLAEAAKIEAAMAGIRKELGVRRPRAAAATTVAAAPGKRVLSPAARKRIAQAQKKRWAAFHAKKAGPRRVMSPATKAKLAANLAKARAAKAAKAGKAA